MRAAILVESRAPLVLADIQAPTELAWGQVRVRIHVSGICGSQIGEIDAVKGPDKFLPHLLGHEGGGTVLEVGPGVRQVKPGDRVVLHWRKGAGIEAPTPLYLWGDRKVNAGWVTTFQEEAVVSENRVTPVPDWLDFRAAALMGCAVTTGLGVVNNDARLRIGQSVLVYGAGGVGLNIIQGAALVSAHPIIAVDRYDHKLEMARRFGATAVLNNRRDDVREAVRRLVGPAGVDVAVEVTGVRELIEEAYDLTSPTGRTILVGVPREKVTLFSLPLHFEKVLKGSHGGQAHPSADIPRYVRLHREGKLALQEMITHTFPLERINEAVESLRSGEAGRVMVTME
jgi:S-(hydroxymethyl)glutathione dehydrogenase/alcohol dehydrogenase